MYDDLPMEWAELRDGQIWLDGKPLFNAIAGARLYLLRDEEGELSAIVRVRDASASASASSTRTHGLMRTLETA